MLYVAVLQIRHDSVMNIYTICVIPIGAALAVNTLCNKLILFFDLVATTSNPYILPMPYNLLFSVAHSFFVLKLFAVQMLKNV